MTAVQTSIRRCRWCQQAFIRPPGWPWVCPTPACYTRCAAWGIRQGHAWVYLPLPLQVEMLEAVAPRRPAGDQSTYVLAGGAAGPGKSHGARWGLYSWCLRIPRLRCLLLREVSDELKRSHIIGLMDTEVPQLLGGSFVMTPVPMARWPNGSFIEGGHLEDAAAVKRYLSAEYDIIVAEEATQYPPEALMELTTRARTTNPAMIAAGGARVWFPTNPGGPSTTVLRMLFLDRTIDADEWPNLAEDYRPEEWFHIRSLLDDNPYLDPGYERKLSVVKQAWRYQQLRHGDWWAAPGLFFDLFQVSHHVHAYAFPDPRRLQWFRAMDYGYHDPGVCLWIVILGDGRLHVTAELKFQGLTPQELVPRIQAIDDELDLPEPRRQIRTWASPDMWPRMGQGGEFLEDTMRRLGVPVSRAKTDRVNGWMRVQTLLRDAPDGTPWLTIDPRCRYLIRSLQTAVSDDKDPNDVAQHDDHALEALRYSVMSRPLHRLAALDTPRRTFEDDFHPPSPSLVGASTRY